MVQSLTVCLSFDTSQVEASWLKKLRKGGAANAAHVLGRRAVRLVKREPVMGPGGLGLGGEREVKSHWVPFHPSSWQANAGVDDKGGGGVVPIPIGPGVILESSAVAGGTRQEALRSLCQVINEGVTPMEVSLVVRPDKDKDRGALEDEWTLIGGQASGAGVQGTLRAGTAGVGSWPGGLTAAGAGAAEGEAAGAAVGPRAVEEEVFENERRDPATGAWGPPSQLRDRQRYDRSRDGAGTGSLAFPLVPLPSGWEWEGAWQVVPVPGGSDEQDGWVYGRDWRDVNYPFPTAAAVEQLRRAVGAQEGRPAVRRRRWVRVRRQTPEAALAEAEAEAVRSIDPQVRGIGETRGRWEGKGGRLGRGEWMRWRARGGAGGKGCKRGEVVRGKWECLVGGCKENLY